MGAGLRSWWRRTRKPLVVIGFIAALVVVVFISLEVIFYGTGFVGKTLWDWMQLLVIPAVLAVTGYVINLTISRGEQDATERRALSEREAAEKRAKTEREIALDSQRETSFKEYIDKMSELILHEGLLGSHPKKEVREIARLLTLTVLNRLDGMRKGSVLQFLADSELIREGAPIIDLSKANLRGAYLREAILGETHLCRVDLSGADLRQAQLCHIPPSRDEDDYIPGANLSWANLSEVDLSNANLEGVDMGSANLTKSNLSGAILSDAELPFANLTGANLSNAKLTRANFYGANLTRANLTDTELNIDIEWPDKDHFGVDLSLAKLKGVIGIDNEELEKQAKSLKGATMPDGKLHH